jgi:hypothetical protein
VTPLSTLRGLRERLHGTQYLGDNAEQTSSHCMQSLIPILIVILILVLTLILIDIESTKILLCLLSHVCLPSIGPLLRSSSSLSYLIHFLFTSPHLTSPHLTSPHFTSPHLTSPHLTTLLSPPFSFHFLFPFLSPSRSTRSEVHLL